MRGTEKRWVVWEVPGKMLLSERTKVVLTEPLLLTATYFWGSSLVLPPLVYVLLPGPLLVSHQRPNQ